MPLEYTKSALLIISGAFNMQIFSNLEWIRRYLFPESETKNLHIDFNYNISNNSFQMKTVIDGMELMVSPTKIFITPAAIDDQGFSNVEELITNLSKALPHIPLHAYGINCRFDGPPGISAFHDCPRILTDADDEDRLSFKYEESQKYDDSIMTCVLTECKDQNKKWSLHYDFNFNFVFSGSSFLNVSDMKNNIINGKIKSCLDYAKKITEAHLSALGE